MNILLCLNYLLHMSLTYLMASKNFHSMSVHMLTSPNLNYLAPFHNLLIFHNLDYYNLMFSYYMTLLHFNYDQMLMYLLYHFNYEPSLILRNYNLHMYMYLLHILMDLDLYIHHFHHTPYFHYT